MESVFYGFETLKQKRMSTEKDLNYWKANAEEDYKQVPISVLRYITELETAVKNCSIPNVSGSYGCPNCGSKDIEEIGNNHHQTKDEMEYLEYCKCLKCKHEFVE